MIGRTKTDMNQHSIVPMSDFTVKYFKDNILLGCWEKSNCVSPE